ncbi:putative leader peptide [Longispora urticae]
MAANVAGGSGDPRVDLLTAEWPARADTTLTRNVLTPPTRNPYHSSMELVEPLVARLHVDLRRQASALC